ncbi:MAG: flavodoxin FldA [Mangrovibacterium sp.]
MSKIGIFYGSSTRNTETIAETLAKELKAETYDVSAASIAELNACDKLILGTSTLGIGDLQDDWDCFLDTLVNADLNGKTIALFGLGDADGYPDSFVDGMGILYDTIKDKGCIIVGETATDGYEYEESKAEVNGKFVGLVLDEDNQSDKTEARVQAWVTQISSVF